MRKVLYVGHNHPMNRPGGAEIYLHELYRAVREARELEPILVTKVGPPFSLDGAHQGTRFGLMGRDPNEYSLYTNRAEFDRVFGTMRDKRLYTEDWPAFLTNRKPDIVHFQHTLFLGYDMLRATRRTLPRVPIVYTLHEFLPICNHSGQMVRTGTYELCSAASPRRCHECFPQIKEQTFFLRQRFIKSAFEQVDLFITPSAHARQRYIEWGLPAEKVVHENYGRFPVAPLPDPPDGGRRRRIGYFGQITPYKGVDVLLEAMKILDAAGADAELFLHCGNLEHQPEQFKQKIEALLKQTEASVRFVGEYPQESLPVLMSAVDWVVVPSIWWETGPLVIHEALVHRRPVICSNIGSMLERVQDGINGLHFRVGDPESLAAAIRRAVDSPELWDTMRAQITDPHPMAQHLSVVTAIYKRLLDRAGHEPAAAA